MKRYDAPMKAARLRPSDYAPLMRMALSEDLGRAGDLTTQFFVPPKTRLQGRIVSREAGAVCGLKVAAAVFRACEPRAKIRLLLRDGTRVRPGRAVMAVSGGRGLLTAERTALNFLQRMSGVASLTRRYVDRVRGTRARILDTRKTLPGWRVLDKYAVACGGGVNHRMGLSDAVMVKDNHYLGRGLETGARELRRRHPGGVLHPPALLEEIPELFPGRLEPFSREDAHLDGLARALPHCRGVDGGLPESVRNLIIFPVQELKQPTPSFP